MISHIIFFDKTKLKLPWPKLSHLEISLCKTWKDFKINLLHKTTIVEQRLENWPKKVIVDTCHQSILYFVKKWLTKNPIPNQKQWPRLRLRPTTIALEAEGILSRLGRLSSRLLQRPHVCLHFLLMNKRLLWHWFAYAAHAGHLLSWSVQLEVTGLITVVPVTRGQRSHDLGQ